MLSNGPKWIHCWSLYHPLNFLWFPSQAFSSFLSDARPPNTYSSQVSDWADVIYDFVRMYGLTDSVMIVDELSTGDDVSGTGACVCGCVSTCVHNSVRVCMCSWAQGTMCQAQVCECVCVSMCVRNSVLVCMCVLHKLLIEVRLSISRIYPSSHECMSLWTCNHDNCYAQMCTQYQPVGYFP